MTLPIGRLIAGDEGRDAVHVAIAPTTAPCDLRPGQHVDQHGNPEGPGVVPVGIVDPFLREPVRPGQRFWLFLYPNTVTSLRHEWTPPRVPDHLPGRGEPRDQGVPRSEKGKGGLMNPQWRTFTVRALCRRMLDTREFDALPILADALEEAGCDDGEFLALCRNPDLEPVLAERAVNLVYSDEMAAAVRWLERFAQDIGYGGDPPMYTYEDIVEAGHQAVRDGGYCWGTDAGADFFRESDDNRREFFLNWSLVTGVAVPEEAQEGIAFRCAC